MHKHTHQLGCENVQHMEHACLIIAWALQFKNMSRTSFWPIKKCSYWQLYIYTYIYIYVGSAAALSWHCSDKLYHLGNHYVNNRIRQIALDLVWWPRGIMAFMRAFRNLQGKFSTAIAMFNFQPRFVVSASTTESLFSTLNCDWNFQPRFGFSMLKCDSNFQPRFSFSMLNCDSNFQPRLSFSMLKCDCNFQPRFNFSMLKCDCNFQPQFDAVAVTAAYY